MPRKNLIRTHLYPYHVTIRCNNREWFELPINDVWKICLAAFEHANQRHSVKLQAFVLMSNHYHALIWTPLLNLDLFMFEFNSFISKAIRQRTKRINRIFGDRYKWCLVDQQSYYLSVLRYVYQNPLKVGLVQYCHEYIYSTLHSIIHDKEFPIDLYLWEESIELQRDGFFDADFANREKMTKALSRSKFSLPKSSSSRRAI
jgi:putative transposase